MNFREEYVAELNHIKHDTSLDIALLEGKENTKTIVKRKSWVKMSVAVASIAAIIIIFANSHSIMVYAENLFKSFGLSVGSTEMEMGEMIPIDFDMNHFATLPGVKRVLGSSMIDEAYYVICEDVHELKEYTGIELPNSDNISLEKISVSVAGSTKMGHFCMDIIDKNGNRSGVMNGQFVINGNENKDSALGYGYDSGSVESIFECSNGTKAYFLKSSEYIEEQVVIFVAYGIQYQLFVDDTKEGTEFAKDVVEMMCQ